MESLEGRRYLTAFGFSLPTQFAAGANPSDVVTADLTGNGKNDAVVSDFGAATVAVLLGNGDGSFQSPAFYPVGSQPEAVAVGDFNGDGIPDIVTANEGSNTVSVLLGNGDGTFQPAMNYAVGIRPESVAVADLNGDGQLDIVTANQGSNDVSVLLNNGTGGFATAVNYPTGIGPDGVALGDLNGDGRPDIATVNPSINGLHVLLNNGDGTFAKAVDYDTSSSPRGITIDDFNDDGRPDIVTADLRDDTISLFLNSSVEGTLQTALTSSTGQFPYSVIAADLNGDGRPDVITANNDANNIGILRRTGMQSFALEDSFFTGINTSPVAVAAADVNSDGRDDLISADFNTASISVLLNYSTYVPLTPTTTTLTPRLNPVQLGSSLQLTAQITPSAVEATKPTGRVAFFDSQSVLGVANVNAAGVATINTSKLTLGTHTIFAHYAGNSVYSDSLSSTVMQVVVARFDAVPFVVTSAVAVRLPAVYVPGSRGTAAVSIENTGAGIAKGTVDLQLYLSTSSSFDSTAIPVSILGNPTVGLQLAGGRLRLAVVNFTVPATIEAGNYTIFAALTPVKELTAQQVSAIPAVGITNSQAVLAVGQVGKQRIPRLTGTLPDGTVVTLAMTGPGTASFTEDPEGGISITLTSTTNASNLSVISTGVNLNSLFDAYAMGDIIAPHATALNSIGIYGGLKRVTLAGATNNTITVGGSTIPNFLSLGTISNVNLKSYAPIGMMAVNNWTNSTQDIITAPWIGKLTSKGDFGATLALSGVKAPEGVALGSATIGGEVLNSVWAIAGSVGKVAAAGVNSGWSGSIRGSLTSFTDTSDFAGQLAARSIGSILINGDLTGAAILAGAYFGPDGVIGGGDDVFSNGTLTSITVRGSASNSVVAAGLVPAGTLLLGPGVILLHASAIRAVTIGGAVDSASKFVASSLPVSASIDGTPVATANDSNFQL